MIYLLVGTNEFRISEILTVIAAEVGVEREMIDSTELDLNGLADVMRGVSLFAERRLVVLRQLSEQQELWRMLGEWLTEVPAETTLVLVEAKPDKRTKTYKTLQKHAKITTVEPLTDRQRPAAERWLQQYAMNHGVSLTNQQVSDMVMRAVVPDETGYTATIDQALLAQAITALALCDTVTNETIATVLPPAREFSAFDLMALAIRRRSAEVQAALRELRANDDPYKLAPLIWSQWYQVVAVSIGSQVSDAQLAKDTGLHPFVVKKTRPLVQNISSSAIYELTKYAAALDTEMKSVGGDPWLAIERFLMRVAQRDK